MEVVTLEPTEKVKPKGDVTLMGQAQLEDLAKLTEARLAAIRVETARRYPKLAALLNAPNWRERRGS